MPPFSILKKAKFMVFYAFIFLYGCGVGVNDEGGGDEGTLFDGRNIAVSGKGYLIGEDEGYFYFRSGGLSLDSSGNIVIDNQYRLQGFMVSGSSLSSLVSDLNIIDFNVGQANIKIDDSGFLYADLNDSRQVLAQIALASFYNTYQLDQIDENVFQVNSLTDEPNYLGPRLANLGDVIVGGVPSAIDNTLELFASNDDAFVLKDELDNHYYETNTLLFRQNITSYIDSLERELVVFNFDADGLPILSATAVLSVGEHLNPQATTRVIPTISLSADELEVAEMTFSPDVEASYSFSTSIIVFDSSGNTHNLDLYFVKTASADEWNLFYVLDTFYISSAISLVIRDGECPDAIQIENIPPRDADGNVIAAADYNILLNLCEIYSSSSGYSVDSVEVDGNIAMSLNSVLVDECGLVYSIYNDPNSATGEFLHNRYQLALTPDGGITFGVPCSGSVGTIVGDSME